MISKDQDLDRTLRQNMHAIFIPGSSNVDKQVDQAATDLFYQTIDDLQFAVKADHEMFGRIHRATWLAHGRDLYWHRPAVCVGQDIDL